MRSGSGFVWRSICSRSGGYTGVSRSRLFLYVGEKQLRMKSGVSILAGLRRLTGELKREEEKMPITEGIMKK
jgi:hypothetical protein